MFSPTVTIWAFIVTILGMGVTLAYTTRVLSRVHGNAPAQAVPAQTAPAVSRRGGQPRRQAPGTPPGNAWGDDGYRVPGEPQQARTWKPERRERGPFLKGARVFILASLAVGAWYLTGFSVSPLAGIGIAVVEAIAFWLTRRRRG